MKYDLNGFEGWLWVWWLRRYHCVLTMWSETEFLSTVFARTAGVDQPGVGNHLDVLPYDLIARAESFLAIHTIMARLLLCVP